MRRAGPFVIAAASIGGISIAAWAMLARVNREIDEAFEFGDLPLLPAEMTGTQNNAGGEGANRAPVIGNKQTQAIVPSHLGTEGH